MEKKLKALFDYQKFEGNAQLQEVIDEVHARYSTRKGRNIRMLNLDEADMVNAAGNPEQELKDDEHRRGTGLFGLSGESDGLSAGADKQPGGSGRSLF